MRKSWIATQILINHFHPGKGGELSEFFPQESNIPQISERNLDLFFESLETPLVKIHYSWLAPLTKDLQEQEQTLFLRALPKATSQKLSKLLKINYPDTPLKGPIKEWILAKALSKWNEYRETLPQSLLPDNEVRFLLTLSKEKLLDLIDYLGIFDLAQEIRTVVDKKLIQQVYECLSNNKQRFLKVCLHQKEKALSPSLSLEHWDGDLNKLSRLLHHRGIVRLAVALSGQPQDFIWHLTHILDSGRGEKLKRYIKSEKIGLATEQRMEQVRTTLKYLQQKRAS